MDIIKKNKFFFINISNFFNGLIFYAPVALLVRTTRGITLSEFFILQIILSVSILLLEIPCGMLTDSVGYKKSMQLSLFITFVSKVILIFSNSFYMFAIQAILEGISVSLMSGTFESYIYINSTEEDFTYNLAKVSNYNTIGFILSTVLYAGISLLWKIDGLIVATAVASFFAFVCVNFISNGKPIEKSENKFLRSSRNTFEIKKLIVPETFVVIIIGSLISMAFFIINFFYADKIKLLGCSEEILSPIILAYSALQLLIPKILQAFEKKSTKKAIIFLIITIGILFLGLYFINNIFAIVLMLLLPIVASLPGYLLVKIENEVVDKIEQEENRATVLSMFSMITNILDIVFLLISSIVVYAGNVSFLVIGILFLIIILPIRYLLSKLTSVV